MEMCMFACMNGMVSSYAQAQCAVSNSLWRRFGIFLVFHEHQIDSIRCSVYDCLCLGFGGKQHTLNASHMNIRRVFPQ